MSYKFPYKTPQKIPRKPRIVLQVKLPPTIQPAGLLSYRINLEWITIGLTISYLVSFLHDINSNGAERTAIEVLSTVLNHVLRVGASYRPLILLWAPWTVPVETADYIVGGWVDEVECACGSFWSVRSATRIDLHFIIGSNGFPFVFTLIYFLVLVTC